MDHLWSPWRYRYVQGERDSEDEGCIFCRMAAEKKDEENFIVHRATRNFVVLNIFPYTTGHMMIVPYEHVASLACASPESLQEMILLAREAERHLANVYRATGSNLGMNLGEMAGAGIAGHIHMHLLPRWLGDTNFMTAVAETRVLPEELASTYRKLKKAFQGTPKD